MPCDACARFIRSREEKEKKFTPKPRYNAIENFATVEPDWTNLNVLGIPTPLTTDKNLVSPALLSAILSLFVGSGVLVLVVVAFPFFFEIAASSGQSSPDVSA